MEELEEKIVAMVISPARSSHIRIGNGFSLAEIKAAGKSVALLKELNIKIDYFRKSAHKNNIEQLKTLKPPKKKGKKRRPFVRKEKKVRIRQKKKKRAIPIKKVKIAVKKPAAKAKAIPKVKLKPAKKAKKAEEKGVALTDLSGLGPAAAKKLIELGVGDIPTLIKEDPKELSMLIKGISEERLKNWIEEGKELLKK